MGKKKKVERIGMEGLKPPYMLLSNHLSFVDFELVALGTYPQRMNNVVNVDGYYLRPWLMEWIGSIGTRKFTSDIHLVKSIRKVLSRGDVLTMYPEARYSPCGTTSYMPESLGLLIKRNKVPVVVALQRGNHLHMPAWNVKNTRKIPMHTTLKLVLTAEQVAEMSVEEINELIRSEMSYDFGKIKPHRDCLDVSTENDSFYCYPTKENVITKIAFATEIIYQNCEKNTVKKRRAAARAAE